MSWRVEIQSGPGALSAGTSSASLRFSTAIRGATVRKLTDGSVQAALEVDAPRADEAVRIATADFESAVHAVELRRAEDDLAAPIRLIVVSATSLSVMPPRPFLLDLLGADGKSLSDSSQPWTDHERIEQDLSPEDPRPPDGRS